MQADSKVTLACSRCGDQVHRAEVGCVRVALDYVCQPGRKVRRLRQDQLVAKLHAAWVLGHANDLQNTALRVIRLERIKVLPIHASQLEQQWPTVMTASTYQRSLQCG